ncbi:MAG: AAA+ family ATPase, partial [bacterium]
AKAILEARGNTPRLYRNSLVFLAADKVRYQDLDEALRKYCAWKSIVEERLTLNLDPHQVKQAETQLKAADGAVTARLPETYQWLLVPIQAKPQDQVTWQAIRLTGTDALAARASKKLRHEDLLVVSLGSTVLRKHMDDVPLWRGEHVAVRQLVEDFGRYLYLPRLADSNVLLNSIRDGVALLTWQTDTFAFAESLDEAAGRYRGLRGGQQVPLIPESDALLVKVDLARKQLDAERPAPPPGEPGTPQMPEAPGPDAGSPEAPTPPGAKLPTRFHGTVSLDPTRVGRDASRIADEVVSHLTGLVGSKVVVTLEIEAAIPNGASEQIVRTVTENSRTLKFQSHGFEKD